MRSTYIVALLALIVSGVWLEWISLSLMYPAQGQAQTAIPTVELAINGGEVAKGFGFGSKGQQLSSPGPTITVKTGDVVKITFKNVGATAHAFQVVAVRTDEKSPVLFKSNIGTSARPLTPGLDGIVAFKAEKAGNYSYICPVPGHVALGMWGEFKVGG